MFWKSLVASFAIVSSAMATDPLVIKPEEAAENIDKEVIVEFTVQSSHVVQNKNIGFLNSERSNRDAKNFTAFITPQGMRSFKESKKITNPSSELLGKKIRVKGKVLLHKEKPEIKIERAGQVELVEEAKKADSEEDAKSDSDKEKEEEEDSADE